MDGGRCTTKPAAVNGGSHDSLSTSYGLGGLSWPRGRGEWGEGEMVERWCKAGAVAWTTVSASGGVAAAAVALRRAGLYTAEEEGKRRGRESGRLGGRCEVRGVRECFAKKMDECGGGNPPKMIILSNHQGLRLTLAKVSRGKLV